MKKLESSRVSINRETAREIFEKGNASLDDGQVQRLAKMLRNDPPLHRVTGSKDDLARFDNESDAVPISGRLEE